MKNKVQLIGKAGKDAEIKEIGNRKMARMSLGILTVTKDQLGQKKFDSQWYNLVAWGGQALVAEKFIKKGIEFAIEGRLVTRSYEDKSGMKKYITEVVVQEILILNKRPATALATAS